MTDNSITNADIIKMTMKALDIVSKTLDLLAADSQLAPAATEEETSEQDAMPLGTDEQEVFDREVTPWDTGDEEMTACGSFKLQTPPLPLPLKGGECLRSPMRRTKRQPLPLKGGECLRNPLRRTERQPLPSLVGEGPGVGSVINSDKLHLLVDCIVINSPPVEQNFSPFSFAMSENVTNFAELFER